MPLLAATLALAYAAASAASAFAEAAGSSGGAPAAVPPPVTVPTAPGVVPTIAPSGVATWFGPGFYGKKTACGQTLTPGVIGVANRTLPCGTLVKVIYAGHTLTVPVLDRGPYSHGVNWDLTAGAAGALGVTETVRIQTSVVGIAPNTPTLGEPPAAPDALLAGGASAG